jgi:hypothetical protein
MTGGRLSCLAAALATSTIVLTAGCGGSTTPLMPLPGQSIPLFSTGRYSLQMNAPDSSSDPLVPACSGSIGVPRAGKAVALELNVVKEGIEWVGHPASAIGDLELRFRDAGELSLGRRSLVGTIRGQTPDMGLPGVISPKDVSVVVAGPMQGGGALLDGQTAFAYSVTTLVGRAQGTFRFRDSSGSEAVCSVVTININAPPS